MIRSPLSRDFETTTLFRLKRENQQAGVYGQPHALPLEPLFTVKKAILDAGLGRAFWADRVRCSPSAKVKAPHGRSLLYRSLVDAPFFRKTGAGG
ncbi:MAG: hypothetical protein HQL51_00295 [Magnetococcales bacterium]|nr:hypothetical protein [Magnetococcales bacterium]